MSSASSDAFIDGSHDPNLRSWVESANDPLTDFPIQNLPFGVFTPSGEHPARVGVVIGDQVADLEVMRRLGLLPAGVGERHVASGSLDALLAEGGGMLRALRLRLSLLLSAGTPGGTLRERRADALVPVSQCTLLRPTTVPNFTDFYAGIHHARRAGAIARPGTDLALNYAWQPVGYHGRASTVRVSGTPVNRPWGPRPERGAGTPVFGPTAALDFELELGCMIAGSPGGRSLPAMAGRIAGLCLLNDWSARDIQRWEMAPLGPFLGKSFATTVSPWLVTVDALAPFRVPATARETGHPPLIGYLSDERDRCHGGFDIRLAVTLSSAACRDAGGRGVVIATSNARHLYWTFAQMAAHHAANGCDLLPGDLIGSGTISGPAEAESGSLLELTHDGRRAVELTGGEARGYLEDGDEVTFSGRCERDGFVSIGFGPCSGMVIPAAERAHP